MPCTDYGYEDDMRSKERKRNARNRERADKVLSLMTMFNAGTRDHP